jgi:hypothetical protein
MSKEELLLLLERIAENLKHTEDAKDSILY